MKNVERSLIKLKELDNEITRLGHIAALLEWDQETYLPPAAADNRASQIALIMGLQHEKIVDEHWQELFDVFECSTDGESAFVDNVADHALVKECFKRWNKQNRVPKTLVEAVAKATALSQNSWVKAREEGDFPLFAPHLKTIIELKKDYAQASSPGEDEYDALLDVYEPGAKGQDIAQLFDDLARGLAALYEKIREAGAPDTRFLDLTYPVELQDRFGRMVQKAIGYNFERGRLDLTVHPFSTILGPHDIRITTRYEENNLLSGLFSNIHEAGHGLYEQGIAPDLANTLIGEGVSLGIHESQSRFWENMVGRSLAFWKQWFYPLREFFPEQLKDISVEDFFTAVNRVKPSLIRVDADEVTYCFHIIIRFRLERAMIHGDLDVADLPSAWRSAYHDVLGISVPGDAEGCLQDVHWSHGFLGYFPTYALGNLYAAQFAKAMQNDIGSLDALIQDKRMDEILLWFQKNIHRHGKIFSPRELCLRISGEELKAEYFLDYLRSKYSKIYNF